MKDKKELIKDIVNVHDRAYVTATVESIGCQIFRAKIRPRVYFSNFAINGRQINEPTSSTYTVSLSRIGELKKGDKIRMWVQLNYTKNCFLQPYTRKHKMDSPDMELLKPQIVYALRVQRVRPRYPKRMALPKQKELLIGYTLLASGQYYRDTDLSEYNKFFAKLYLAWKQSDDKKHFDSKWSYRKYSEYLTKH